MEDESGRWDDAEIQELLVLIAEGGLKTLSCVWTGSHAIRLAA